LPDVWTLSSALRARAGSWQPLSTPISTSPLIFRQPQADRDGVLMAGDAAGFVDPFVGDGISLALRSGVLAATCVIPFFSGELSLEAATHNYRRAYQDWLGPIFRSSARIRRVIGWPRAIRLPLLSVLEKTPSLTRYVVTRTR